MNDNIELPEYPFNERPPVYTRNNSINNLSIADFFPNIKCLSIALFICIFIPTLILVIMYIFKLKKND